MLNTRLILFEGLPGSGKSTTARNLASEIARTGLPCQDFFEWSDPHPIDIGGFEHVGDFIASAGAREGDLVRQWRAFALSQRGQALVTVMESRFWQTTAMLMLAGGCSAEDIFRHNQRVIAAIQDLRPVLIYFTTGDVRAALARTIAIKNAEWRQDGRESSWEETIFGFLKNQKWFANRGPRDLQGTSDFFVAWSELAERLYAATPFPKLKIQDPYLDWGQAMNEIRVFLDLS